MAEFLAFVGRHGYLVLFVFAEQVGLPLPALPILLAGGALARTGELHPAAVVGVCLAASLLSDVLWYEVGRRRGGRVMGWLCRISLEPDSCVRNTEAFFARHGARSLLVAKFVPGLNANHPLRLPRPSQPYPAPREPQTRADRRLAPPNCSPACGAGGSNPVVVMRVAQCLYVCIFTLGSCSPGGSSLSST